MRSTGPEGASAPDRPELRSGAPGGRQLTAAFKKCIFVRPPRRTLPPLIYRLLVSIRHVADVEHLIWVLLDPDGT